LPVSDFTITNGPAFTANVRVRRARGEGGKYVGVTLLNPHIAGPAQLAGRKAAPEHCAYPTAPRSAYCEPGE